jgi:hypothetical protein
MNYLLIDNATNEVYIMSFSDMDFNLSVKPQDGNPPTLQQARIQIDIWNRAQKNYKNEFTYLLENI